MNKEISQIIYQGVSVVDPKFQPGSVVEGRFFAFSELQTAVDFESIDYCGYVPFTGSVIVVGTIGDYVTRPLSENIRDLCIIANKMRVIEIKRFVNGTEAK